MRPICQIRICTSTNQQDFFEKNYFNIPIILTHSARASSPPSCSRWSPRSATRRTSPTSRTRPGNRTRRSSPFQTCKRCRIQVEALHLQDYHFVGRASSHQNTSMNPPAKLKAMTQPCLLVGDITNPVCEFSTGTRICNFGG